MAENVPDLTLAERQIVDVISRADRKLAAAVSRALEDATERAAEDMRAIGQEDAAPALQYFAAVVHQRMYCLMCGADPDTFEGETLKLPTTSSATARTSPSIIGQQTLSLTQRNSGGSSIGIHHRAIIASAAPFVADQLGTKRKPFRDVGEELAASAIADAGQIPV